MKRARKAKVSQAPKLRNSAKGKVPKSALGELREDLIMLRPGLGTAPWGRWHLKQDLKRSLGIARIPAVCPERSGALDVRRWRRHVVTSPHGPT